jgi:hypothetical protein
LKYTQNYNLRKPEDTDPADIQDLNYNADAIDGKLKEIEDWEAAHLQASNPHSITPALIGAETPTGAQQKANQAETNAKSYADIVTNSALNSAKDYADDVLESANSHTDQVASDLSQKVDEIKIKVLDVEQDVSNISKVLTNLNPDQEAKQSVSGYGILSLPENAANSPVSFVIKGKTEPKPVIYGASWDKSPSHVLARTDNSVGKVANIGIDSEVVDNDFDNAAIFRDIHEVTDEYGNVFIRIPKLYIRKTNSTNLKKWQISTKKFSGFYLPWCFWDFDKNKELPYVDIGRYKASLSADNRLESKPGVFPLRKRNIVQFRDYAQANGPGYQQLDIHAYDLLQTLFYVEFATLNSQSIMQGYSTGQYSESHKAVVSEMSTNRIIIINAQADLYRVGQYISIGTSLGGDQVAVDREIISIDVYNEANKAIIFDGDSVDINIDNIIYNSTWKNGFSANIAASSGCIIANDGKYPHAYRKIESIYADMWQFVDGVNINDNQAWVCNNAAQYASNAFANPYEQLNYINANTNGYVKEMGFDELHPFAEFPISLGGDAQTYYSDYYYQAALQRIARVGGYWYSGGTAGLSYWNLYNVSSNAYLDVGGRLLKKPL